MTERIGQFPCVFENLTFISSISVVQKAVTSSSSKWTLLRGLIAVSPGRWGLTVRAVLETAFHPGWPGTSGPTALLGGSWAGESSQI